MISLTAILANHLGVSDAFASIIKYIILGLLITLGLMTMKAGYDAKLIKTGYDKCKAEQTKAVIKTKDKADEVTKAREVVIQQDKTEQRTVDMVTRSRYDDLKREKDNDRLTFERLLQNATQRPVVNGTVNCANERMPSGLQRRGGNNTRSD